MAGGAAGPSGRYRRRHAVRGVRTVRQGRVPRLGTGPAGRHRRCADRVLAPAAGCRGGAAPGPGGRAGGGPGHQYDLADPGVHRRDAGAGRVRGGRAGRAHRAGRHRRPSRRTLARRPLPAPQQRRHRRGPRGRHPGGGRSRGGPARRGRPGVRLHHAQPGLRTPPARRPADRHAPQPVLAHRRRPPARLGSLPARTRTGRPCRGRGHGQAVPGLLRGGAVPARRPGTARADGGRRRRDGCPRGAAGRAHRGAGADRQVPAGHAGPGERHPRPCRGLLRGPTGAAGTRGHVTEVPDLQGDTARASPRASRLDLAGLAGSGTAPRGAP
ncbi:hypothetical protein SGPA1_10190 [Streptomyces misionensis JCM 4497]